MILFAFRSILLIFFLYFCCFPIRLIPRVILLWSDSRYRITAATSHDTILIQFSRLPRYLHRYGIDCHACWQIQGLSVMHGTARLWGHSIDRLIRRTETRHWQINQLLRYSCGIEWHAPYWEHTVVLEWDEKHLNIQNMSHTHCQGTVDMRYDMLTVETHLDDMHAVDTQHWMTYYIWDAVRKEMHAVEAQSGITCTL
jgi:hypothetical protein